MPVHEPLQRVSVCPDHPHGVMRRSRSQGMVDARMPLLRRDHDADQTKYRMREKMFSIGDDFWIENQSYGVEIASGQDGALILAVVVCVDQMSHD